MPRTCAACLLATCLFLAAPYASAESPSCADAEMSRQFDFWIGEWTVTQPDGKVAGTNSIRPILDGCVLQETWSGAGGSAGSSFNFYDPERKAWRQLWVWRQGTTLETSGGLVDGAMVLGGNALGRDGSSVHHRITWTPIDDGTVRQHWQASKDDGATWQTVFDGLYRKTVPSTDRD